MSSKSHDEIIEELKAKLRNVELPVEAGGERSESAEPKQAIGLISWVLVGVIAAVLAFAIPVLGVLFKALLGIAIAGFILQFVNWKDFPPPV